MAEGQWQRGAAYAAVVVVAGVTYFLAQTAIDRNRATLPISQYFECLRKVATFDWKGIPGERPSASEICKELARRERR